MKKQIITLSSSIALCLALSTNNVLAQEKKLYEKPVAIGFGAGATTGALIAGPVGAFFGGTLGLLIGNIESLNQTNQKTTQDLQQQKIAWQHSQHKTKTLAQTLEQSQQKNQQLNQQLSLANNTINSAELVERLKLNLQFKVNSSDVESLYQQQIQHLVQVIKHTPELTINLSGFADRNGDETQNLELSNQRIANVKAMLIEQGIDASRISSQAFGESSPMQAQQSYQNDFYDRRVEIQLMPSNALTADTH